MSLTLGLNTALSGLLTSQRGLDVISQNVVNVNTVGYTRKVMNQESRVLAGFGAGVQEGSVTRMVNESLLKDIRRQNTQMGTLEVEQQYYPRIDDLFGQVGNEASIAHRLGDLRQAFESLGTETNKPAIQWATSQAGLDVTNQLNAMTTQLQQFRLSADRDLELAVSEINEKVANIHDLNMKIVKHGATSTGTSDLEDKRDIALSELSSLIDIDYYRRSDDSLVIFTTGGELLLDNKPNTLNYSANTAIDPWMTAAGGNFNKISVTGGTIDLDDTIRGGKVRALLDFRDTKLANLQANLDQLAVEMRETINQVHNRGTVLPAISSRYEGSRVFAGQSDVQSGVTSADATLYWGTESVTVGAGGYGASITWGADTTTSPQRYTVTAAGAFPGTLVADTTFSVEDPTNPRNSGTYKVLSVSGSTLTVEKVNVRQTIQLGGTDDVVLATFDSDGNQLQRTTLNSIMQTDYSASFTNATAGDGRSVMDFTGKDDRGDWSISEVTAHIEGWLKANNYSNASVNLDDQGKLVIDVGDSTVSLAFRDQGSSTAGASRQDAVINFDVNGDGTGDQSVSGFSNFFGLNDFFTSTSETTIYESSILPSTFATTTTRYLSLSDNTGAIGGEITIPRGSSLEAIAEQINENSHVSESTTLTDTSWNLTSQATISVSDGNTTRVTITLPAATPGTVSLYEIAGQLTQNGVTASVVEDRAGKRLRVVDDNGNALTVSVSNGAVNSTGRSLSDVLKMEGRQRMHASVIPEGSGYRLRIVQSQGNEMYVSSRETTGNLTADLGLQRGVSGAAQTIQLRPDLSSSPQMVSRGAMQWNSDTGVYYLSEGDSTTALELGKAMATKNSVSSAGTIFAGKYSLDEYASSIITMTSTQASASESSFSYQKTLGESLDFQYSSFSGVNLDEEVSRMIDYQQAYSAAARVISAIKDMLDILTDAVR